MGVVVTHGPILEGWLRGVEVSLRMPSPMTPRAAAVALDDLQTVGAMVKVPSRLDVSWGIKERWVDLEVELADMRLGSLTVVLAAGAGGIAATQALVMLLGAVRDWRHTREAARVSVLSQKAGLLREIDDLRRSLLDDRDSDLAMEHRDQLATLAAEVRAAEWQLLHSLLNDGLEGAQIELPIASHEESALDFSTDPEYPPSLLRLGGDIESVREIPLD